MKKGAVELVFIPSPGIGHLVATVEIAKLLVGRDDQLHITVLIMKLPFESKGTDAYTQSSNSISQRINFINLPEPNIDTKGLYGLGFFKVFIEAHKPHVRDAVAKLVESGESKTRQLAGLVVDMFCTTMIDVADEFGVPSYVFFTSNAGCLGLLLHLEKHRDEIREDVTKLMHSGGELVLPSFANPLPTTVLPSVLLEKESATLFLDFSRRFSETKGILVNSFMELESHALRSLSDGTTTTPPVYSVGPMLNKSDDKNQVGSDKARQKSDIFEWLDDQPPTSVVFLCFGSMGCFGEDQVKEIACALEHSGLRFLWSLREPPPKDEMGFPSEYSNPGRVLPEGFLDRTAGIGKVIGWAPQVDILAHPAVGGFVSHCGWNSLLESLWYGVPVATWPMYAEQQLNAFEMVKELSLAVEVDMHYKKDEQVVVSAQDIERGIRQVMELDSDIRKRVKEISQKSKKALMDGGSSYSSLGRFIDQIYI